MSRRKLSRLAGLVFALAVVFGGAGVGAAASDNTSAIVLSTANWEWL